MIRDLNVNPREITYTCDQRSVKETCVYEKRRMKEQTTRATRDLHLDTRKKIENVYVESENVYGKRPRKETWIYEERPTKE